MTRSPYFPFRRIKIISQTVSADAGESLIVAQPRKRHRPVCHGCGQTACGTHSWAERTVRDLSITTARVWISCRYRKLFCPRCHGVRTFRKTINHSPRGVYCNMGICYECRMIVNGMPNVRTCMTAATPGCRVMTQIDAEIEVERERS